MTPEEARTRADHAKRLLEDQLLKASLASVTEAAISACAQSKDEKEAWRACSALKACMDITRALAAHMETAKVVEFNVRPTLRERIGI
jgi:hypothetical protein